MNNGELKRKWYTDKIHVCEWQLRGVVYKHCNNGLYTLQGQECAMLRAEAWMGYLNPDWDNPAWLVNSGSLNDDYDELIRMNNITNWEDGLVFVSTVRHILVLNFKYKTLEYYYQVLISQNWIREWMFILL